MDWKEIYQSRVTSAEQAVKKIKSGDRVVIAHATGEPVHVTDAMVANADAYENVEIIHMVSMGKSAYCAPGMEKHFRHNAFFLGGTTRAACAEGRADITPVYFSKEPELLRGGCKPDVALVTVTPPDRHGYVSLGISVDYTMEAVKQAPVVIAQVNKYMPRIHGDSFVHVSEISDFVEFDEPVLELPNPKITDVEREIGRNCASLINDGDCLQLGIGAIPDAVLLFLKDKKDLGIHSEMISDGVVELVEAGVITNKKKTLHTGKSILTFAMGTRRLYDYLNDNPAVGIYPVDYVNDPLVIAQNDNMVSINSCVQVDLMGQVVSTSVGHKQISGVGGQVDFVRGAAMSKNGRSIMAMPSTAAKGKVSKIVSIIDEGAAVTTSRYDVQFVVTEYGVADLRGITLRERAVRLIRIAHPDFRPQLIEFFEKKFCCKYEDQD
ncbi:acetyl-CoA hydrolase/transferase family protein [Christensenella timonensis]|uniref:acetyl-CoA hydrolase/transferase family protein n=1 Tax=Christensenella timonensis TaxID=1816678 RepID=UPI00082E80ED|nr:acetyl-CoA hydrolase/transferase C-terminal domain-containing protein [Christensenella timonensis]